MKKILMAVACAAAFAVPAAAMADETGFAVQFGPTSLKPANKSDGFTYGTAAVPADAISVSKKTIPEIDVLYGFTPNIVAEVVLTIPQSHDVMLLNSVNLGSFKELPPTFLAQWHFLPGEMLDPYVGAGVNLTMIWGTNIAVPANVGGVTGPTTLTLDSTSIGFAYQAGLRVNLDKQMFLNVDYKHAAIGSDVKAGGAKVSHVNVDPNLIGVSFGLHF
jgi:outer membrane protein